MAEQIGVAPSGQNLLLGRGEVFLDRFLTGTKTKTGERHLGNCSAFSIEVSVEKKEKNESMTAASRVYASVPVKQSGKVKITCDEFAIETLACAIYGEELSISQVVGTATDQTIGTIKLGRYYPVGNRSITVTSVKQGAVTLIEGTDYTVDAVSGRIYFVPGGAATEAATTWSGSWVAKTYKVLRGSSVGSIQGFLRFKPAPAHGPRLEVEVPVVSISPSGELPFIGDDFGSFSLEADILWEPGSDPFRIFPLD